MFLKLILLILSLLQMNHSAASSTEPIPLVSVTVPVESSSATTTSTTSPPTTASSVGVGITESWIDLTNLQRANPLQWDQSLANYAYSKLATQIDSLPLYHSNISVLLSEWNTVGENLGTGATTDEIQEALLASPTHFENIVYPGFTHFGSATRVGSNGNIWTVHIYGG